MIDSSNFKDFLIPKFLDLAKIRIHVYNKQAKFYLKFFGHKKNILTNTIILCQHKNMRRSLVKKPNQTAVRVGRVTCSIEEEIGRFRQIVVYITYFVPWLSPMRRQCHDFSL